MRQSPARMGGRQGIYGWVRERFGEPPLLCPQQARDASSPDYAGVRGYRDFKPLPPAARSDSRSVGE